MRRFPVGPGVGCDARGQALRPGRRSLLGLGAALVAGPAAAAPPPSSWLSVRVERGRTLLALALDRPTAWRLTALDGPPRLLLDLPNLPWRGPARLAGAGLVKHLERQG